MHDRRNDDDIAFDSVNDSVRETTRAALSVVNCDLCPGFRVAKDAGDRALDFVQELQTQTRNGVVVIVGGFGKVAFRGRKKAVGHLESRLRNS